MKKFILFLGVTISTFIFSNKVNAYDLPFISANDSFLVSVSGYSSKLNYSFENADKDAKKIIENYIVQNNLNNIVDDFGYVVFQKSGEGSVDFAFYLKSRLNSTASDPTKYGEIVLRNANYISTSFSNYSYNVIVKDGEVESINFITKAETNYQSIIKNNFNYLSSDDIYYNDTLTLVKNKFETSEDNTTTQNQNNNIFTQAGETMTGIVKMAGNFFSALWETPMGQIIITLGLVSAAIGLCYKIFLRKKHV